MRQLLERIRRALAAWWAQDSAEDFWDRQW